MTSLNLLPIISAGIVSALIGFAWYHPKVFGTAWMRLANVTPEMVENGKKKMHLLALLALLAGIVAAYVLNYFLNLSGAADFAGAIKIAALAWAGFVAPALLGMVLWEQKPISLYLINSIYWLVALLSMSVILII